jgi:pentatricopeptide repeat protein
MSQCKRENKVEVAEEVYQLGKLHLPELERSFYSAMMNVYVHADRMDDALRVYEEMLEGGMTTDVRVFNILLLGYSNAV